MSETLVGPQSNATTVLGVESSSSLERALSRSLQMPGVAWDVVSVDRSGRQRKLTAAWV